MIQSSAVIARSNMMQYITAVTATEYKSEFGSTNCIPYLALDELCASYRVYFAWLLKKDDRIVTEAIASNT